MQQTGTRIRQVGRVVVPVSDQARAKAFYTEKLGFEVRSEVPMSPEYTWLEVAPAGAVTTLAIVPPPEGKPVGVDTGIAFESPDIEADHAALKAQGVEVDAEIMRMGDPVPPMFFFRDPDSNIFLVTETA
jgi:catechol 2,3-dioxygenase-like lactoylglutathione lyase family enzyme